MLPASNHGLGMNMGFPDICVTPMGPIPTPVPYPNMGMHAMTVPFAVNVMITMVPGLNMVSEVPLTLGDQPGVLSPFMGPGGCVMGNPTIMVEMIPGMNLLCPTEGNDFIDPLGAVLVPAITNVFYTDMAHGLLQSWTALPQSATEEAGHTTHPMAASGGFALRVECDGASRVCEATVLHVWRGSAGEAAGLTAGDRLVETADRPVTALSLAEIKALLAQPRLALLWAAADGGLRRSVVTAAPDAETLTATLIEKGIGLIELRRIPADAGPRLRAALALLAKAGARAALLDLRNNGGGVLEGALDAAALFLPRGAPLCCLHQADGDEDIRRSRTARPLDLPLAILVNRGTASSAEILAASLQANKRARIVGETSFGKAVAIRYGAAPDGRPAIVDRIEVMTPDGVRLQGVGIAPDILAPDAGPGSEDAIALGLAALRGSDGEFLQRLP